MSLSQWPPMLNKTGPKPCILTAWKYYGGSSVPWKKYTSHNEVSTWQNHNNNWNGKSKREKGTPSQRVFFNVTTRLCHWHCAWRGLCGLGECWWERQCSRSWPSCAVESNSSATVWAFAFVGMYVCVCVYQLVRQYVQACLCVCLHVLYMQRKVCVNVYVCSAVAYIQYACIPHLSTQTHTTCFFWDIGQNWASYCFLVFTSQNGFFYSASLLPFLSLWRITYDEWGRGYLIQTSCTYVCFTSEDGWTSYISNVLQRERTKMLSLLLLMYN